VSPSVGTRSPKHNAVLHTHLAQCLQVELLQKSRHVGRHGYHWVCGHCYVALNRASEMVSARRSSMQFHGRDVTSDCDCVFAACFCGLCRLVHGDAASCGPHRYRCAYHFSSRGHPCPHAPQPPVRDMHPTAAWPHPMAAWPWARPIPSAAGHTGPAIPHQAPPILQIAHPYHHAMSREAPQLVWKWAQLSRPVDLAPLPGLLLWARLPCGVERTLSARGHVVTYPPAAPVWNKDEVREDGARCVSSVRRQSAGAVNGRGLLLPCTHQRLSAS